MSGRSAILAAFLLSGCIGQDKLLHAGMGYAVGAIAEDVNGMGCEAAIAIGIAKELIDPVFSTLDVIATAAYCLTLLK